MLILAFLLVLVGWQNVEAQMCPEIRVIGPPGLLMPGEPVRFIAEVKGAIPADSQYKWTVKDGEIIDGQGTPTIITIYRSKWGTNLAATLEITSLPANCPNSAFDVYSIAIDPPYPILVEEGSVALTQIDKPRLDSMAAKLAEYPGAIGYIIEYFPAKTTRRAIDRKVAQLSSYLAKTKGVSTRDSRIVTARATKLLTKYYVVPPGSDSPVP